MGDGGCSTLLFVLAGAVKGRPPAGAQEIRKGQAHSLKTVSHQEDQPRSPGSACTSRHLDPTTRHSTTFSNTSYHHVQQPVILTRQHVISPRPTTGHAAAAIDLPSIHVPVAIRTDVFLRRPGAFALPTQEGKEAGGLGAKPPRFSSLSSSPHPCASLHFSASVEFHPDLPLGNEGRGSHPHHAVCELTRSSEKDV